MTIDNNKIYISSGLHILTSEGKHCKAAQRIHEEGKSGITVSGIRSISLEQFGVRPKVAEIDKSPDLIVRFGRNRISSVLLSPPTPPEK